MRSRSKPAVSCDRTTSIKAAGNPLKWRRPLGTAEQIADGRKLRSRRHPRRPKPERSIHNPRYPQHHLILKRPRRNLHPDRQSLRRTSHRNHRRRRAQRVEPLRIAHRVQILHRLPVDRPTLARHAATLERSPPDTAAPETPASLPASSRAADPSPPRHSATLSPVSGLDRSAISEKLPKDRTQLLAPAAHLRLIEHRTALHKECPPQFAQWLQRSRPERLHANPASRNAAAAARTAARVSAVTGVSPSSSKNPIR